MKRRTATIKGLRLTANLRPRTDRKTFGKVTVSQKVGIWGAIKGDWQKVGGDISRAVKRAEK